MSDTGSPLGLQAVAAVTGSLMISCLYDSSGTEWCMLFDNPVLAWVVDTSGAAPPQPVILGTPAPTPPDTDPIESPQWIVREGGPSGIYFAPDLARGTANQLFTSLATNNGARRKLYANFADISLIEAFKEWAAGNPGLALSDPPQ